MSDRMQRSYYLDRAMIVRIKRAVLEYNQEHPDAPISMNAWVRGALRAKLEGLVMEKGEADDA